MGKGRTWTRRRVLVRAAGMAAAAAWPGGALPARAGAASSPAPLAEAVRILGPERWKALSAAADCILPAAAGMPSASQAGVMEYLQEALSGPYRHLLERYRSLLDRVAQPSAASLAQLERLDPAGFAMLRQHVIEGYFCEPSHGGNRRSAGWEAVGLREHHHHRE
jgi:hypothetical protein